MSTQEQIAYFRSILPQRINLEVVKNEDDGGVWATVTDLPHCYTQATSINELPDMVTDLILTHFEVPEAIRDNVGQYLPMTPSHIKFEEMCNQLIRLESKAEAGETVQQMFSRFQIA